MYIIQRVLSKLKSIFKKLINYLIGERKYIKKNLYPLVFKKRASMLFSDFTLYFSSSFECRAKILEGCIKNKLKNIVYIYDTPDFTTMRYRVINFLEIINQHKDNYKAHLFYTSEIKDIRKYINNDTICIFVRVSWTLELDSFIQFLKLNNIKVIYDIDDLIFREEDIKFIVSSDYQSKDINHQNILFGYLYRKIWMMNLADVFITTNEFLGLLLNNYFKRRVYVIYNSLNKRQVDFANNILSKFNQQKQKTKYIGYFSGSSSHNNDFSLISDHLVRVLSEFSNVNLVLGGYLQIDHQKFNNYKKRIIQLSFTDFMTQMLNLSSLYINLIPLILNDFNNSKSELKYFESAIFKVPSIASPTFVYKQIYERNPNNIVLSQNSEWYQKIKELILNEDYYRTISQSAYEDVINTYTVENILKQINNFLDEVNI